MALDAEQIYAGIIILIVFAIMTPLIMMIVSGLNQEQCMSHINDRDACLARYRELEAQKAGVERNLDLANERYFNLTNTNVTKEDIRTILQAVNQSRQEITILNSKFDTYQEITTNNYVFLVRAFTISVNVALFSFSWLVIDFVVASITGVELKDWLPWVRRRKHAREQKKQQQQQGGRHGG